VAVAGAAVLVLILVYGTQWLQYHELIEAGSSLASAVLTGRSRMQDNIHARDIVRLIDQVNTTQELSAMIEENAETFRFAHMQLRRGMSRQTPPQARLSDVSPSRLWALDYPIVTRSGLGDPFYLSVWCSTDSQKAASAERIVRILAPALERWMLRCREQISTSSFLDSFPESRGDVRDTPADVVSLAEHGRNRGRRRVSSPETRPDV
jgi:hypothetical protein